MQTSYIYTSINFNFGIDHITKSHFVSSKALTTFHEYVFILFFKKFPTMEAIGWTVIIEILL